MISLYEQHCQTCIYIGYLFAEKLIMGKVSELHSVYFASNN